MKTITLDNSEAALIVDSLQSNFQFVFAQQGRTPNNETFVKKGKEIEKLIQRLKGTYDLKTNP